MSPLLFAYAAVAFVWAVAFGVHGINVSREAFARALLGAPIFPLVLLWWARPSWLWREQGDQLEGIPAELRAITRARNELGRECERLRSESANLRMLLEENQDTIASLRAERAAGMFR